MTLNQRRQILLDLETHDYLLTEWGWNFLYDVRARLEAKPHVPLSDRQEEVLEKLHREVLERLAQEADPPQG